MQRQKERNGKRMQRKEKKKCTKGLSRQTAERAHLTDAAGWGHGGSGGLVRVTDVAEETLVSPPPPLLTPPPPPLLPPPPPPPSIQRETCNSLENATLFARLCNIHLSTFPLPVSLSVLSGVHHLFLSLYSSMRLPRSFTSFLLFPLLPEKNKIANYQMEGR